MPAVGPVLPATLGVSRAAPESRAGREEGLGRVAGPQTKVILKPL